MLEPVTTADTEERDEPVRLGRSKRDAVLSAAGELLLANGYERTSMGAVAERAGVSKTTVYAHFAEKIELFRAVMAQTAAEFVVEFDKVVGDVDDGTAEDRLIRSIVEIARAATAPQFIAYFRMMIAEIERREELRVAFDDARMGVTVPDVPATIGGLLVAVAGEGGFEVEDPTQHATILLRATVSGLQFDMLVADFRPSDHLITEYVAHVVHTFLRGLRPDDGQHVARLPEGFAYPWVMPLYR